MVSFHNKVKNIIRQNKKGALHEFLFGSKHSGGEDNRSGVEGSDPDLDQQLTFLRETMKLLQTQVNSLQEKVIHLKNQLTNIEDPLKSQNKDPEAIKIDQQSDSSLNPQSANLLPNDSEVRNPTSQRKGMESKSVSDDPKIDFKPLSSSQQYNIPSNQNEAHNQANLITLGKISEQEKLEIIQRGFQLQNEGKISLKKYYEGVSEANSLFQLKGYRIKYDTIRKTKLYQNLKEYTPLNF